MNQRLKNLQQILKRKKLDALLISKPANVSYISNFKGQDSCIVIPQDDKPIFITDFRYIEQAQNEINDFRIMCVKTPLLKNLAKITKGHNFKKIGFESAHLS